MHAPRHPDSFLIEGSDVNQDSQIVTHTPDSGGLMAPRQERQPQQNTNTSAATGNYTVHPRGTGGLAQPFGVDRRPVSAPNAPTLPNGLTPTVRAATPASTPAANPATVAGQMDSLLKSDSPLMQDARDYANQTMNSRGLMQSSIAVGASQDAAMRAMLPIAQQDASSAYTTARDATLNTYDTSKTNLLAGIQKEAAATAQGYDLAKIGATTAAQQSLAEQAQGFDLEKINANLAASTALSAQEAEQLKANGTQGQYNQAVLTLQTNYGSEYRAIQEGSMTAAQKELAIASLDAKYASDMKFTTTLYAGLGAGTIDPKPFLTKPPTTTPAPAPVPPVIGAGRNTFGTSD